MNIFNGFLDHSELMEFEDGELVAKTGEPADWMFIIVEGRIDFYMNVNGRLVFYHHFANDVTQEGVTGLLPYSRMKIYPGNSIATGKFVGSVFIRNIFRNLNNLILNLYSGLSVI